MKNLCLFLSMDARLVSDTRLIYPLKIAESQRLKGGKVDPEIPEFDKAPSRSLMIMARLGEWNERLLSARCNVSTLLTFLTPITHLP
jgi:hypothetical protein